MVVCNFRVIKLIMISWRTGALGHSGHENVERELQNIILILLIRIVFLFLHSFMERTESVSDEKQFNEDRNSTKLIHSHYTVNTVIFSRAFKLFLMCQTCAVVQSWQSQHCSSLSSVGFFS